MLYLKAIKATQMEWQLENLKIVHFTWVSQPCNAKNTVNTTVFASMDGAGVEPTTSGLQAARGGGDKSDSINKSAFPAPGIFLAKARGTPASIASFRE